MPTVGQKSDRQSDSKKLTQLELLGGTQVDNVMLDVSTIRRQTSLQAAIGLCISASGKDRKQVYGALDIDAATFSRIESGQCSFPPNKLQRLMDLCGNEAPLIWIVEARGYDWSSLRKHRSDEQQRIAELEQELLETKRAFSLFASFKR